ncbi:YcjF family protein [Dethiosulfatarculus sandiegensis]|uniref:Uncharacterized protein n=1 Tax=Dethiosulfatarculus sandiegensis TaxID=1429043 RepID=A0A0D2GGE1_9BACT|nr:YcjF family protein [Dethiosulfatarculus sandiegensis]KIX13967.1 hypothetical protein X474_12650 [Dethiosulfatarculus sandiegensis]
MTVKTPRPPSEQENRAAPEEWVADPNQAGPALTDKQTSRPAPAPEPELGMPNQPLGQAEQVPNGKSLLLDTRARQNAEMEEKVLANLQKQTGRAPGWLNFSWLKHLVLGLCGLSLVVLATQALSFISLLQGLPDWARYGGYGLMGLLCLLVLWSLGRFLISYMLLRQSPRISLTALRSLEQRANLRQKAHDLLKDAQEQLCGLLTDYPLKGRKKKKTQALGFSDEEIEQMAKVRKHLLELASEESTEAWLMQFEKTFLEPLDQAAKKRITRRAWLVSLKTAAAPSGFLSAAIVVINAYQLMNELCAIYQLRTGGMGTVSILLRIFVNAFAASQMEEWMDQATQGIIGTAATGTDAAAAFFKVLAGGIMSRAAEGGANAFLLIRLGAAGMHYLRPLTEKTA